MAKVLTKLRDNADERVRLGSEALAMARAEFDPTRIRSQFWRLLQAATELRRP